MEKISKKLLTSKFLDLGRKNPGGNKRDRKYRLILEKITEKKLDNILKYGIFLIIPLLILTPEIRTISPAIRIDEVLLALLVCIYFIYKLKIRKFQVSVVDYLFGALFISVLASIFISIIKEGAGLYFRDLFEVVKIIKYYLLYRIVFNIKWSKRDLTNILKITAVSFFIAISLSFMQYFNLLNVNSLLMPYFTKENHIRAIMVAGRVVGTFKNANVWSMVLGIPMFYIFGSLIIKINKKPRLSKGELGLLLFLFFVLSSVLMTMGRTSIVANFTAIFFVAAALLIYPYKKISKTNLAKRIFTIFAFFIIISSISFAFVAYVPHRKGAINIMNRFEAGLQEIGIIEDEGEYYTTSWQGRSDGWRDVLVRSKDGPIFGFGPSKDPNSPAHLGYAVDNEYLLYFYRYGLLGLCLYLSMFGLFLFFSVLNLRNTTRKMGAEFVINIISLGISVSYPLYNILAGSFYNFQLFPLFIIFNSLNIYVLNKYEKK